jgi:hypothetical protein
MTIVAVPDACVLIPGALRDTILRSAQSYLFRVQLTDDILDEVHRNLIKKVGMPQEKADRLLEILKTQFSDEMVTRHRELIDSMPINVKDRHVMAAAVSSGSQIIITQNLRHFPKKLLAPYEIEAQSPDAFLKRLYYNDPEQMTELLYKQAANLRKPAMTLSEVLDHLHKDVPHFASLIRQELQIPQEYAWAEVAIEVESDK